MLLVTFDPVTGSGGIEGRTNAYTEGLEKRSIHVEVAAVSRNGSFGSEAFHGTTLHRLSCSWSGSFRTFSTLAKIILGSGVDTVFFLSGGATTIGLMVIGFTRVTGRKCGVFFYGRDVLQARKRLTRRFILALSMILAGGVATNSRYTAGLLPGLKKRVTIVYPGIDPRVPEKLAHSGRDRGGLRILFVGRLVRRKGADLLLSAFDQLHKDFPGSVLDVVGDGPEMGNLKDMAAGLRLGDSVMFHGALYGSELWEIYAQSSLLVLPSRESADDVEGFGTVFIEAGSFGVPSVGTRTGGIPEAIVDRVTGLLVESEDVGQLKDAIKRLLSDPDDLARLGRAAKARASEFTWDSSLNQVLQVFGGTN